MSKSLPEVLQFFQKPYSSRLGEGSYQDMHLPQVHQTLCWQNPLLKPENGPRLLLQKEPTEDVIILTHGLSDSPYYLQDIARHFYKTGCQVVMPLLPAHGLIDPDQAMKDELLNHKWRETIDHAVETAQMLGSRISIGGFSAGGALSLNYILRNPSIVNGGLFLFSGALSIGGFTELVGRLNFIQSITRITDGEIIGIGNNPYRYPVLPSFAGIELVQIINENKALNEIAKVKLPVFAAHSMHDTTVELAGILYFLEHGVEHGVAMLISDQVSHSSLTLEYEITMNMQDASDPIAPQPANPVFGWMIEGVIKFFRQKVML